MRKNLYLGLIACAALTMTGCSNDEISYDSSKQEAQAIQFDTYLGKNVQGRGTVLDNAYLTNMGVFASYGSGTGWDENNKMDFMYNQLVTKSGTWSYAPLKYWPTKVGDKISFFAYAPQSTQTTQAHDCIEPSGNSVSGAPKLIVTYPEDLTEMVDLVADVKMNQTKAGAIAFTLKHEMTRVGIQAKVSDIVFDASDSHKKTTVVIKSVKLNAAEEDGELYESGIYTFATATDQVGAWTPTVADVALDLNSILNLQTITKGTVDGKKYSEQGIALTEKDDPVNLFKNNQYLFLVPVSGGLKADKATVTIAYDIVTEDPALEKTYSCTSATKTISLPTGTLQQGTAYTYTFTIQVTGVELSATVSDDWTRTTGTGEGTVDYNSTDN